MSRRPIKRRLVDWARRDAMRRRAEKRRRKVAVSPEKRALDHKGEGYSPIGYSRWSNATRARWDAYFGRTYTLDEWVCDFSAPDRSLRAALRAARRAAARAAR